MELVDLAGTHLLSGVDMIWKDDMNGIAFELDGKVYECYEDPDDGYRSYLTKVNVSDRKIRNRFQPHEVFIMYSDKWDEDYADLLEFYDTETDKVVLTIGTNYGDNYYPFCVLHWNPENLAINSKIN